LTPSEEKGLRPAPPRVLFGSREPIFKVLPESVRANLRHPTSENALLWNLIYPLAQPTLQLAALHAIRRLWGTVLPEVEVQDTLKPYFWGYSTDGERLSFLDEVLEQVDGAGPRTEVDLFLVGGKNLILVEAKHMGLPGRCSRYANRRCPEIHVDQGEKDEPCRYWENVEHAFNVHLDFGERPDVDDPSPACNKHYQLGRTFLVGHALSQRFDLPFQLWMIVPRQRWTSLQHTWLDFSERVLDNALWRRMRVIAWEDLA
jgi:hypothetical protein